MIGAEVRVLRIIALLLGVAGCVFGLLTGPQIAGQLDRAPAAWTVASLLATLGLPVLLGVSALFAPAAALRWGGTAVALGNASALATVPLVFTGARTTADAPWVLQLTALGTTGAAIGLHVAPIACFVVLTGALVVVDRLLTGDAGLLLTALQDGAYAVLFCAVFAALAVGTLRAARSVDGAHAAAAAAVTSARDQRVHAEERRRVDGLVHDHVLATLLVAARSPQPSRTIAADAQEALDRLTALIEPTPPDAGLDGDELLDRLRAQVTSSAAGAQVVIVRGVATPRLPLRVGEAMLGATGEALRNSRRHAGPTAAIEVHVAFERDGVEIVVLDDGIGFDRLAVPADRLGVAISVLDRMRTAGGEADVRSRPGRGTAVRLRWPRS